MEGVPPVNYENSLQDAMYERNRRLAETQACVVDSGRHSSRVCVRQGSWITASPSVTSAIHGLLRNPCGSRKSFAINSILPAISLSLVVACVAKPPFKDAFITFSESPHVVVLDPEGTVSLGQTVLKMSEADFAMDTNFEVVFLDLLPLAIPQDQMIKRIFMFTDMQFDASQVTNFYGVASAPLSAADWETSHDVIERAYKEVGYEMPHIVYWDLSNPRYHMAPVTGERKGSPSLLKLFMEVKNEDGDEWEEVTKDGEKVENEFDPVAIMRKVLGREGFEGLVVVD